MKLKQLLLCLLTVLGSITAHAYEIEANGVYYNITDANAKTVEVTYVENGTGNADFYYGNITIPKRISKDGVTYTVKEIGYRAFYQCANIISISLPDNLITIGEEAFSGCSGLTSVAIPSSVTNINHHAFWDCTGLTSVNITDLSAWCKITFGNSYNYWDGDRANPLFYAKHLYLNGNEVKDLVIPEDVTAISNYAFLCCEGLTSVTIHNAVSSIGRWAFRFCTGLTSVDIPGSVTSIGAWAFSGSGLNAVQLNEGLTEINNVAFEGCPITSIILPLSLERINGSPFASCTELTYVTVLQSIPLFEAPGFSNRANATLYVPAGRKAAYEAADGWKEFKEIKELPITDISQLSNSKLYTIADANGILKVLGNSVTTAEGFLDSSHMGLVTSVSQLSSPSTDPYEGSLAALLDNDPGTFWHSNWHDGNVPAHTHYLQVELTGSVNEDICLQMTRRQTGNDHITQWGVYGSNSVTAADGEWEELTSISMPYGTNTETLLSSPFDTKGYKYLRFYIDNTTGGGDGQTRGFGHLSEFRLFTASDIAAYQPANDTNCQFAIMNINDKYYLYSPAKRAFWLAQGDFCPGFGSAVTISDNNASDDFRWTLSMPLDGRMVSLNKSNASFKITPVEDFDPTEALAAFTENAILGLADGYYRIRCAQQFTNTVTDTNGQASDVQVYKYMCGSIDGSNNAYGSWCTPENLTTDLSSLWKLTNQNGAFDLQNMYNQGRFTTVGKSTRARMSETSESLLVFDRVTQMDGQNIFNIRVASQNMADYYYLHMAGHADGWGVSGDLVGWLNTGTSGASEWILEPVSAAEAAVIMSVAVGDTFTAPVPCGDGTVDLTFKVTNRSPWEVEVSASPEDIAGALTIPATVQNENGIEFAVKGIGDNAFSERNGLTSVVIPESVYNIGGSAFAGCTGLTSVTIIGDLAHIWGYAFQNCTSLSDVSIHGVYEISINVFYGCSSLKSITLPEGLQTIGEHAFSESGLESITFPSTVTEVGEAAFHSSKLNSIDFNDCTMIIGGDCFAWCANLEEVFIPRTVTLTGYFTFACCSSLKTVVFEEGNPSVDLSATFIGAYIESKLEEVVLPSSDIMDHSMFSECKSLKTVTFLSGDAGARHYFRNFIQVPDDVLFIVPDGTAESFLKKGYKNLSDKSGLPMVREEFEAEAARIAAMADGLTDGNKTALTTAISEARTAVNTTDDYMTVYAQIVAVKDAAKAFLATATLPENFDVTAAAVTNPNFDRFDIGWKVANIGNNDGYIETQYTNEDVTIEHFTEAWRDGGNLDNGQISQTITNLPAGTYRLECDAIATWQYDDGVEVTGVNLFGGTSKTAMATQNERPQHFSVEFTQYKDGDCTIGIDIHNTNANWVAMDNVRLYRLSGDTPAPLFNETATYYIQNVETGKFLSAGNESGTHAVLADEGLPVNITQMADGSYTIFFLEGSWNEQLLERDDEVNVYVDYNPEGTNQCPYWTITPVGDDGTYHIQSLVSDGRYGQQAYPGTYLGNDPTKEPNNDVDGNILDTEGMNITWRFVTKDTNAFDNAIYIENTEGITGGTVMLNVKMKNVMTPNGCAFRLTLPEGMTLAKDEDGDVIFELGDRARRMSVKMKDWNNGSYDFALIPGSGTATISGNDGTVVSVRVRIPDDATVGDHKLLLTKNLIQTKTDGMTVDHTMPDVLATITIYDYILGDVNGDGKVTPSDAIMILYHYFNVAQTGFRAVAADLNGDGKITPSDAIEALYKYFGSGQSHAPQKYQQTLEPQ